MPLAPEHTSLLCPVNDLEAHTILELAEEWGLDVHRIEGEWGLTLPRALAQTPAPDKLRDHVVVVEMPGDASPLRAAGKFVHAVDHHAYGSATAQLQPSSLEQFAELMGKRLSAAHMAIAINDRDFLPGLSRAGFSWEEARQIRARELAIRGETENMAALREELENYRRDLYDLRFALAPQKYAGVMLEALQTHDLEQGYRIAADSREAVKLKPTLVLYFLRPSNPHPRSLSDLIH